MSVRPAADAADGSITVLLMELGRGNRTVEPELAELVHCELRRLAAGYMRRERADHTLQPTALVNEAWARLAGGSEIPWQSRTHFFAVASSCMRQILIDHARKRRSAKRGGARQKVTVEENLLASEDNAVDLLGLNEVLERLRGFDERACQIVELHFFGGLSFVEIGEVLKISTRTASRDWTIARAWLRNELSKRRGDD